MNWIWVGLLVLVASISVALLGALAFTHLLHHWSIWRSLPRETREERRSRRCRVEIYRAEDFLDGEYRHFALSHARRAYRLEPTNAHALLVLAMAWAARQRYELAVKHLEEAYRLIEHEYRDTNQHAAQIIPEIAIEAARVCAKLRIGAKTELEREGWGEQVLEWAALAMEHDPDEAARLTTDPLLRDLRAQVRLMPPHTQQHREPPR